MGNWIGFLIAFILILFLSTLVVGGILLFVHRISHQKWLLQEMDKWEKDNLITTEAKKSLEEKYAAPVKEATPPTKIVILIGSILSGIGLLLFIASNWKNMGPATKLIGTFLLSLLCLFYGKYLKSNQKNPMPTLGEGFIFISTLIWGATIIFLFQHYQIANSNNYLMTFLWGASIFPVAFLFQSDPVFYLSYFLLFLTGIFRGNLTETPCYLFLVLGYIPFLLASENKKHKWIPVSVLGILLPIFTNFEPYGLFYLAIMAILVVTWYIKKETLHLTLAGASLFFFILTSIREPLLPTWFGHFFFMVPFVFLLTLSLLKKTLTPLFIILFSLFVGLIAQFSGNYDSRIFAFSMTKIMLLVGIIYLLIERFIRHKPLQLPFQAVGFLGLIVPLFILSFQELITEALQAKPIEGLLLSGAFTPFLPLSILALSIVAGLLLYWVLKRPEKEVGDIYLLGGTALPLLGLLAWEILGSTLGTKSILAITVSQNVILLCILLFSIFWAAKKRLNWLININLVLFLIFVFIRYFDVSWKLLDRSWFFIGGGAILLVIGFFMEKVKRKLVTEEQR